MLVGQLLADKGNPQAQAFMFRIQSTLSQLQMVENSLTEADAKLRKAKGRKKQVIQNVITTLENKQKVLLKALNVPVSGLIYDDRLAGGRCFR